MVHGYAEHCSRYDRVVASWVQRRLTVARFDLRGHGLSEGPRGHVQRFEQYTDDVTALLDHLEGEPAWTGSTARGAERRGLPVLFGHSLGGLIATHVAAQRGDRIGGLALTSPFFGLTLPVAAPLRILATVAARIMPGLRQASGLNGEDLTHDIALARGYDSDPLGFHHATAGWYVEAMRAQKMLPLVAPKVRTPVLLLAAGEDRVASTDAARRTFDLFGSPDKELDVLAGLFHELLNEPEWPALATRIADRVLRWSST
jgi:alpha-beta hydrolase superfamily lysophospholipase